MKRYVHNVLIIVAVFASVLLSGCTDSHKQRLQLEELERQNRADSVMQDLALAQSLADHFDRHGTRNEQLRAHYILGRTHADRGELPQAVAAYNDAADLADTSAADCDYRTLSRVHAQTAQLYYSQLLPDNMIRHERLAMKYAEVAKDTMQYLYCYGMLAEGYDMKNMPDSALNTLLDTYLLYKNAGLGNYAAALCCSIADIYLKKDSIQKAKEAFNEFESNSGFFDNRNNIQVGKEIYYYLKGCYYIKTFQLDSAEFLFRKEIDLSQNGDNLVSGFKGLQMVYENKKEVDSLVKYVQKAREIANIYHNEIEMQSLLHLQSLYNLKRSERIAYENEHKAERFKTTLIIVAALFVILALLSTIVYIRNQNEKRRLKDRIRLLQGYAVNKNLYDSPTAQRFRELLKANPYQNPSLNDWKELSDLINREIPGFRDRLQTDSYQLSDNDYDVCMLIKIQVSSSDIARLKQCSPSYVTHIRKKVFKSLFLKKGKADELDEYIMSLS